MKTLGYKLGLWAACLLLAVSCNDFLEEDANGRLLATSAFSNKSDLDGSVHTLYRQVSRASFGISQFIHSQAGDDLSTHPASNKAMIREWDQYKISTDNDRLLLCWQDKFKVVRAANFILTGAESTPDVAQADLDYALGQAHFWRAWAYFYLVRAYGPLPKLLTAEMDYTVPLSPVAEIFELIVSDLKTAEQKLPANYTAVPQSMNGMNVAASKGAAQAVLSYVYLTMAGWPLNRGTEYYSLAAEKALEVINGAENGTYYYQLYDEFWKIHSKQENHQNKEAICAIYYSLVGGDGDDSDAARGTINDTPDCADGWVDTRAEIGYWVGFPDGPRKAATYPEWTIDKNNGGQAFRWWKLGWSEKDQAYNDHDRTPYFGKSGFTNPGNNDEYDFTKLRSAQSTGWGEQIHQLVRLSEVYLFYAEAVGRAGRTDARAIELLNKVRNRADGYGPVAVRPEGQNVYSAGMSASELAEAAYNEHGWEIAGWYWGAIAPRVNDMQRMDRIKDHFNTRKANPEYVFTDPDTGEEIRIHDLFGVEGEWSQSKMYAPYPSQDARRNPALDITTEQKLNMIN
ncbi:MAG: RagB/SusD family nutrient uptake outer membrane protein [Tannerella sp.]|jgi:hypothetical protein|nr:RagB/SusD family nutrient uptake outer membrane protein [Tannerella sp.]